MEFEKSFGTFPNITLVADATKYNEKYKPNIKVQPDGSLLEFYIDIHIRNPIEPQIDAAKMITKAVTNISFFVNDNYLLWGMIHQLQLTVLEFEPYFQTDTKIETINQKLTILKPLLEAYANSILDDGWHLPLNKNFTKYIKKPKVEPRDGYLLIDADTNF